jgi:hypothetical protein
MVRFVGHQYTTDELWAYRVRHADLHADEEAALRPLARGSAPSMFRCSQA